MAINDRQTELKNLLPLSMKRCIIIYLFGVNRINGVDVVPTMWLNPALTAKFILRRSNGALLLDFKG